MALDTSNQPMTVALVEDDHLMATTTLNMVKNHSTFVLPTIDQLMTTVGWEPADLDRVVVANGPGSYTGIRIATTTAKGLAKTLGIELVTVSSLEVVAAGSLPQEPALLVPFFDARRGNVFAGGYAWRDGELTTVIADRHVAMSDLLLTLAARQEPVILLGTVTPKLAPALENLPTNVTVAPAANALPSSWQLARLGSAMTPVPDIDGVVPNYLRITEAEAQWKKAHPNAPEQPYVREV